MSPDPNSNPSPSPPEATFEHAAIVLETEELEPNYWRVTFEVPAEQVGRFVRQLKLVKPAIHPQEISTLLITVCLDEAVANLDRTAMFHKGLAPGSESPTLKPGSPFKGTFDLDAFAEPAWPDFSLLTISRDSIEVSDALVDREMMDQRLDAGNPVELDGPLEPGDRVTGDFHLRLVEEEKPLQTATQVMLRVPAEEHPLNLAGVLLRDGGSLRGHRAGDTVTFQASLPENLQQAELRGREVDVAIEIGSTHRIEPATEEAVAAQYGSPSVDILKMQIRHALQQRLQEERRASALEQLLPQMVSLIPIPIPARSMEVSVKKAMQHQVDAMKKEGLDDEAIKEKLEQVEPRVTQSCLRRLQRSVLFRMLARHLEIGASEDDLLDSIKAEAARVGRRPEDLRKELVESDRLAIFTERTVELRVIDRLLEMATVL